MLELQNVPLVLMFLSTILTCQVFDVSISEKTLYYNEALSIDDHKSHHYSHDTSFIMANDSVRKKSYFYRNGNIKFRIWSFYDRLQHIETKMVAEKFSKTGKRRFVRQYIIKPDFGALIAYEARYDREGKLVVEGYYSYDSYGNLMEDYPEECNQ